MQDYKYFAPGTTLVYVYLQDDAITPFHTGEEIEDHALSYLKEATATFTTENIYNSTTAVINVITPAFTHAQHKFAPLPQTYDDPAEYKTNRPDEDYHL